MVLMRFIKGSGTFSSVASKNLIQCGIFCLSRVPNWLTRQIRWLQEIKTFLAFGVKLFCHCFGWPFAEWFGLFNWKYVTYYLWKTLL